MEKFLVRQTKRSSILQRKMRPQPQHLQKIMQNIKVTSIHIENRWLMRISEFHFVRFLSARSFCHVKISAYQLEHIQVRWTKKMNVEYKVTYSWLTDLAGEWTIQRYSTVRTQTKENLATHNLPRVRVNQLLNNPPRWVVAITSLHRSLTLV